MLLGDKPIALLVQWDMSGEPKAEMTPEFQRRQDRTDAQIVRLDAAVSEGRLLKQCVVAPPPTRMSAYDSLVAHFYCQHDKVREMQELISFLKTRLSASGSIECQRPRRLSTAASI
ncbi:MAG: hypothetical protein WB822_17175 [Rhodoplanes sp.]